MLLEVAGVLGRHVRSFDILGKCDPDRFMLLMPQTNRRGALEVAERLRAAMESHSFSSGQPGAVTLSIGVAISPKDGAEVEKLLEAADRALHQATEQGKNRVATLPRRAA